MLYQVVRGYWYPSLHALWVKLLFFEIPSCIKSKLKERSEMLDGVRCRLAFIPEFESAAAES
jgi:hypothetical protein